MTPMRRPWWIAVPLAWAAVVAIVALVAWWVIDAAGRSIIADPAHDVATPGVSSAGPSVPGDRRPSGGRTTGTTAPATPSSGAATGSTTSPEPPPTSSGPTAPPPPPTSSGGGDGGGGGGGDGDGGGGGDGGGDGGGGARPITDTWHGEAGILRVTCTGTALRLDGASPHDGYVVDQTEREGGRELEVKFRSTDGRHEVEIHVVCVGGAPRFTVEQSDDDD